MIWLNLVNLVMMWQSSKKSICFDLSISIFFSGFVQDRWRPAQSGSRGQTSLCLEANNVVVLNDQTVSVSLNAVSRSNMMAIFNVSTRFFLYF